MTMEWSKFINRTSTFYKLGKLSPDDTLFHAVYFYRLFNTFVNTYHNVTLIIPVIVVSYVLLMVKFVQSSLALIIERLCHNYKAWQELPGVKDVHPRQD